MEVWLEGNPAGMPIAEFGSRESVAIHSLDFTDDDCLSLFAAVHAAARAFADAMNEAERLAHLPAPEPAPETVPFEPYRMIAKDPLSMVGRRKGRKKKPDGPLPQDGDVLGP